MREADQHDRNSQSGQNDLFGLGKASGAVATQERMVQVPDWHEDERLAGEMETLGLYLTGHPISQYEAELRQLTSCRLVEIQPNRDAEIRLCGLVSAIRTMNSRRGPMAFVTLDDKTARVEVTVYSEVFRDYRSLLVKSRILVIEGTVSIDERTGNETVTANRIMDLEQAREVLGKCLELKLDPAQAGNGIIESIKQTLEPWRDGGLPVAIAYMGEDATVRIPLGKQWRIRPANELLKRLQELVGEKRITTLYH